MGYTIAEKIIKEHIASGKMIRGSQIAIKIDQTLTQDATGTMAYLQLEALGIDQVKTEKSVAYIDHNTLQSGFMNADDHRYIGSVAKKHGIYFSRPGNGICHQVHLERFACPGKTLIGSDSHTPTAGGIGMLACGAGGFDVAVAMAGYPYHITMPQIVKINLTGSLNPWVSAKDIILKVLQILTVKGGVGKIIEYGGSGVLSLSVPDRATITNMGAELGATTSIFPSDEITRKFLKAQGRESDWIALSADEDAVYDEIINIDLDSLTPMIACPHSPDNVKSVDEVGNLKIDQVCIGSCTNSSITDMMKVAYILKGKKIHPDVSLSIAPGSKQVLTMLAKNGLLADIIDAGARVLESACGPCIGMGQSPNSGGISLRTFNRNFVGRSGTKDAKIYLVSPEVAAYSAIEGILSNPINLGDMPKFEIPDMFVINDNMIEPPAKLEKSSNVKIIKGPNIKSFPVADELPKNIEAQVILKVEDNITTDHIMPAGSKILPYRSNIPYLSQFCFEVIDPAFAGRAKAAGKGIIIGGVNYGQGSSREHAALVPLYLGIKAVIAKSFARIHEANLINTGILPITFSNQNDYDNIDQGDELELFDIRNCIENDLPIVLINRTKNIRIPVNCNIKGRNKNIILAGGLLNHLKKGLK
ncbi:MAG: aconitate hydratase [Oscillospiraceae bacterium]|nr:aconitate hydratase [Oscillospiraceae bacterium]